MAQILDIAEIIEASFNSSVFLQVQTASGAYCTFSKDDKRLEESFKAVKADRFKEKDKAIEFLLYKARMLSHLDVYYEIKNMRINWNNQSDNDVAMYSQSYINSGSTPEQTVFQHTWKKENTFEYSFTEGVKVGASLSYVPGASGGFGFSSNVEIDFSATQTKRCTESIEWSINQAVNNEPNRITNVIWVLKGKKGEGTITADVVISGDPLMFIKNHEMGDLWGIVPLPLSTIVTGLPGFTVLQEGRENQPSKIAYTTTFNFKADFGFESILDKHIRQITPTLTRYMLSEEGNVLKETPNLLKETPLAIITP